MGQFKQLIELSNTDPRFNEKLKQFLIPNKAREHVALAVENDKRLRMWYPEPNNIEGGLLYRSVRARVDLEHPDGQRPTYAPLLACSCITLLSPMLLCMHGHQPESALPTSSKANIILVACLVTLSASIGTTSEVCFQLSPVAFWFMVVHKMVSYGMTDFEKEQDCMYPVEPGITHTPSISLKPSTSLTHLSSLAAPFRLARSDRTWAKPFTQE